MARRKLTRAKADRDWNPLDEPRDYILLGGLVSPGICEIVGADSPRNYEEREGPGLAGALLVFRGVKPSHFSVKFRLITRDDWRDWHRFKTIVTKPPIGKRPRPLDIVHPLLEPLGIHAVVVENVKAPVQADDGVWEVELDLIESRKLKFSLSKPEGGQDTPLDPLDQELADVDAERKALVEELAHTE